eukprot:5676803-Prymnesium_polylepis.2
MESCVSGTMWAGGCSECSSLSAQEASRHDPWDPAGWHCNLPWRRPWGAWWLRLSQSLSKGWGAHGALCDRRAHGTRL